VAPDAADSEVDTAADDPLATKLALAHEFNTIGDTDGARTLIEEVIAESSGALKARAQRLLADLG
jgi:pilus assembly protein FimV